VKPRHNHGNSYTTADVRAAPLDLLTDSNNPLISPLGGKALIDTGGPSSVGGAKHVGVRCATAPWNGGRIVPAAIDARAHPLQSGPRKAQPVLGNA
jgi:hypothetical protein